MNGQEFATAVQYDLPIIVLIMDNGMYGTIRAHQEREFPGRIIATALKNPDFAAYARAFGGFGATSREDRGFRRRLQGRAGVRQARDPAPEGRPAGDQPGDHARRDPRKGDGAAQLVEGPILARNSAAEHPVLEHARIAQARPRR